MPDFGHEILLPYYELLGLIPALDELIFEIVIAFVQRGHHWLCDVETSGALVWVDARLLVGEPQAVIYGRDVIIKVILQFNFQDLVWSAITLQVLLCEIIHNKPVLRSQRVTRVVEVFTFVQTKIQVESSIKQLDAIFGIAYET